jgi:hypothetical protein
MSNKHSNFLITGLLLVALCFLASTSNAQEIKFKNNWGPQGMTLSRQSGSGVEVNFSVPTVILSDVNIDGEAMKAVTVPGIFLPNDAGKPDLAGTGRYIAVPNGATVKYTITSSRKEVIKDVNVAPAMVIPHDDGKEEAVYYKDMNVFGKDAFYPENPVQVSQVTQIRGVNVILLGITPFQYNPVTKELIVYTDLKVTVDFVGGNGQYGNNLYRSRWFEPILSDAILNYSSLPQVDFDHRFTNIMTENGYEYVIISPNNPEFLAWADTIKAFRTAQGIKTGVVKISDIGGNTVEGIKSWVVNAYNTWTVKPVAICLLADYGTDATGNNCITSKLQPDSGYPDFASDNYYADVNGDEMPEIVFSRIIANNNTELQTLITKELNYEKNPPTNPYYYSHPITALGWQTERWFQLCSELVGGYFHKVKGKTPVRINKVYSGTPSTSWSSATNTAAVVSYFGPQGTYYIPQTPDSLGGFDGGTPTQVVNAINTGAFLLQHRDHGEYIGWGEPGFNTNYIPQLTNTDLTFVYSINCETGAYHNPSGCPANGSFVEVFYRYKYNGQNSGALGLVCPSEVSYSFVNDTYVWGMYDNMWPDFMPTYGTTPESRDEKPAFGMAAGKYFLQQSSWPYNTGDKLVTYRLFHMHGDAFLNLYSEVPQNLTVNHASAILSGVNSFLVTANAGSFIAITCNGQILGTATGTGSPVSISIPGTQIPGDIIKVVVTKQNYYRYNGTVTVIPPTGAYCIKDSVAINDAPPLGNGNGLMDYGETNKLALRLKNVGSATANNVTAKVTTTDPYVTMTDSTETYGTIAANSTLLKTDAFAYTVANNIPDGRVVNFTVTATDGSNVWPGAFSITAHSASIKLASSKIVDSTGNNNGRWDAGETVNLKTTVKNTGTSAATGVVGVLMENDPYVTINTNNQTFGTINPADSSFKYFSVTSAANTPVGYTVTFILTSTGNLGITHTDTLYATIGQNIATIGTGTAGCDWPFYSYYMDARTQMLYTASEISATGVAPGYITKIAFDVTANSSQVLNGFNVKMKNFSGSSLSGFETTGMSTVFSGTYTVNGTGWQEINLTSPIQWDGTSNLVVEVCYNNSSYTTSSTVNGTANSLNQMKHQHQDLSSTDGCTAITSPSTSYTARPNIRMTFSPFLGAENQTPAIPTKYDLSQNYPNPFNPVTKINFALPKTGFATLKVYDILGRQVSLLVNEVKQAGYYSIDFDATKLASGVYFYKLESGTFSDVKRMVLVK